MNKYIPYILIVALLLMFPLQAAVNEQTDSRTYYTIKQGSINEIGSGYGTAGAGTPDNVDGTGFYRIEVPVDAISGSTYTDDGIWFELGNLATTAGAKDIIDQAGGTGGTYGTITGVVDGANQRYDTAGTFTATSLRIYLNGQLVLPDGDGYTVVDTDSFDMVVAPPTGSVLLAVY